jgi:GH15 family glucan-1,4-alpha-glucosidase
VRIDGYLPIADYALIGDGHTAALVGRDGSIDWLCLPRFDAEPVFDRILDAERGGRFELQPVEPFEAVRRYREHTNVLEATFTTASGSVRVTDAMLLGTDQRELVRVVDPRHGRVRMRWDFRPRTDVLLASWDAGDGEFELGPGTRATFVVAESPPTREDAERRLELTAATWMDWAARAEYDGRWREPVLRSALTLKLLTYSPTGAIVAAPTTSLPERIGGDRNWDYRFCWLRDGIYMMRALLLLGYRDEAEAFFRWQLEAIGPNVSEVKPLYRIDGSSDASEEELPLPGYRGSQPVRNGNAATSQLQLDVYGHLLESASRLRSQTGFLDPAAGRTLAALADVVAGSWRSKDAGIWEVRDGLSDFVQSKAMCWTALDRAAELAAEGAIPGGGARWRAEADAVRAWIESEGWNEELGSYVRAPELGDEVDASLLSLPLCAYSSAADPRFLATAATIRRELGAGGPLLYRTRAAKESEGAFLTCSFWLVDALGRGGRTAEGHELMAELVELANDVGLFGEELDPATGEHLGNFPQGLVHLALVNAAVSLEEPD